MDLAQRTRRKAISPVLATVILIAITLIAATAIAGFVFGLFGSFTSSAQVSAVQASLPSTIVSPAGLTVQNMGTSNADADNLTLTYGGVTCAPTITATTVTAGAGTVALPITALGSCVA
jgi:flagellin-like protein